MNLKQSKLVKGAAIAAAAAGAFVALSAPAQAYVACNRWHECWRVNERYHYPVRLGVVFHRDDWRHRHHERYWRWRDEHRERGYYRQGVWRRF